MTWWTLDTDGPDSETQAGTVCLNAEQQLHTYTEKLPVSTTTSEMANKLCSGSTINIQQRSSAEGWLKASWRCHHDPEFYILISVFLVVFFKFLVSHKSFTQFSHLCKSLFDRFALGLQVTKANSNVHFWVLFSYSIQLQPRAIEFQFRIASTPQLFDACWLSPPSDDRTSGSPTPCGWNRLRKSIRRGFVTLVVNILETYKDTTSPYACSLVMRPRFASRHALTMASASTAITFWQSCENWAICVLRPRFRDRLDACSHDSLCWY